MRKSKQSITKLSKTKAQYSLDKQTAKISALSSVNVGKYEFLTGEDVLPEIRKEGTMKRFCKLILQKTISRIWKVSWTSEFRSGS